MLGLDVDGILFLFYRLGHWGSEKRIEVVEPGGLVPGSEMLLTPVLKWRVAETSWPVELHQLYVFISASQCISFMVQGKSVSFSEP